jgi:serine/threonine protein kinase
MVFAGIVAGFEGPRVWPEAAAGAAEAFEGARERVCRHFFRQLARGLHFMHGCGVIHRDLKPDQMLLKPPPAGHQAPLGTAEHLLEYTLLIGDFGEGKDIDTAGGAVTDARTSWAGQGGAGGVANTVFKAPEAVCTSGGRMYGGKGADTWAAAAVLSMLVTLNQKAVNTLRMNARGLTDDARTADAICGADFASKQPTWHTFSPELKDLLQVNYDAFGLIWL